MHLRVGWEAFLPVPIFTVPCWSLWCLAVRTCRRVPSLISCPIRMSLCCLRHQHLGQSVTCMALT